MSVLRRDLFKLLGGAAAGAAFTPLPWRALGDSAIWTQNWSWMPRTPRGEVTEKATRCTLCPAACRTKAKCVGGTPFAMMPAGDAMCAAGFAAHHMAHHPARLKEVRGNGRTATVEEALAAARAGMAGGLAVLDLWPGRAASLLHRKHMKTAGGAYLTVARTEGATAMAAARMSGEVDAAFDLSAAKLVLSIATAVGDGWGAPGRTLPALRVFTHVQAEAKKSRAAEIADEWIRIREGGETALVLGCTRALFERDAASETAKKCEGYSSYRDAVLAVPMDEHARDCGVAAPQMIALSERLQAGGAVVADGGAAAEEAAALNILLGTSACVARRAAAAPREWDLAAVRTVEEIEDDSVSVLLIDEPIPGLGFAWGPVERKLRRNAVVVAMAWSAQGAGRQAQWHVPAPVFVESPESAPAGPDESEPQFAFSEQVMAAPAWVIHAADFTGRLAGDSMSYADRVKAMGEVATEQESTPLRPVRLPASPGARRAEARATPQWRSEAVSPLMGKLSKEWNLREVRA